MRYIWFVCICLTLAIGGQFTCGKPKYFYETRWYEIHLDTIKEHLDTVSKELKGYYAKNSRYPDNNEGLAVLTDFRKRLAERDECLPPPIGIAKDDSLRHQVAATLRGRDRELFAFDEGVLSPWFVPFVYENRRGLKRELFTDSPATEDSGQNYSIKVDDGIYVYSVGARIFYKEYKHLLIEMWTAYIVVLIILLVFIFLFIKAKRFTKQSLLKRAIKMVAGAILILIALLIGQEMMVRCYAPSYFGTHRRPEMMAEYNALLDKYHQRGVINDVTYQKIKTALEKVDKLIEENKIK